MDFFYMIYVEGKNSPTKKFTSLEEANDEAERLCIQENRKVYILESHSKCEMKIVTRTRLNLKF